MQTKHFNKNQGFAHVAILLILVAAAVILVGFNKFGNKFLASPVCTTAEKLATLKVDMTALEKQIEDVNAQITANNAKIVSTQSSLVTKNSEITKTQSLIYSDSTIASYKKTSDNAYLLWQRNKTRPYKAKYDQYLGVYNTAVASNTTNNAKLATLNAEKAALDAQVIATDKLYVELNTTLAKYSSDLVTLKASITDAESNPCPTKETVCTDKIDDDKDGKVDCNDSDCSTDPACTTIITGGGEGDGGVSCEFDTDCSSGQTCNSGVCVGGDFVCGNGIVESTEECDDGNKTSGDGCDASCANEKEEEGMVECTYEYSEEVLQYSIELDGVDDTASAYSAIADSKTDACTALIAEMKAEIGDRSNDLSFVEGVIQSFGGRMQILGCRVKIASTPFRVLRQLVRQHIYEKSGGSQNYLIDNPNGNGEKIAPKSCKSK
jgi:cysteine-rich repeat protein